MGEKKSKREKVKRFLRENHSDKVERISDLRYHTDDDRIMDILCEDMQEIFDDFEQNCNVSSE